MQQDKEPKKSNDLFDFKPPNKRGQQTTPDPNKSKHLDLLTEFNETFLGVEQPSKKQPEESKENEQLSIGEQNTSNQEQNQQQQLQQQQLLQQKPQEIQLEQPQSQQVEQQSLNESQIPLKLNTGFEQSQALESQFPFHQPSEIEMPKQNVVLGIESNEEDVEEDIIPVVGEFKPKEKYASIVISDDDDDNRDTSIRMLTKKGLESHNQKMDKLKIEQIQNQDKKPHKPFFFNKEGGKETEIIDKSNEQKNVQTKQFDLDDDIILPEPKKKQIQEQKKNTVNYTMIDIEDDQKTKQNINYRNVKQQKLEDIPRDQQQQYQQSQQYQQQQYIANTQGTTQQLDDYIPDDDANNVQDMDLQQEWNIIQNINDIQNPKFQGYQRAINLQDPPRDLIKAFYGDMRFKDLLKCIACSESDFWLWLGVKVMMGYMKLPDQNEYFFREDWVAGGGIRSVITQLGFEEVESKVDIVTPTLNNQSALAVKLESNITAPFHQEFLPQFMQELNEKFKKTVTPGQELLLIQNLSMLSNQIDWYQLIDRSTGFIIHQFFWNNPDKKKESIMGHRDLQKRLRKMFEPYHLNRHIVYSSDILDAESIMLLHSSRIYVCTDLKHHALLPQTPSTMTYFASKSKEPLYLFYKNQWITFASQNSLTQRNSILQQLTTKLLNEEKLYIQPPQQDVFKPSKLIFIYVLESILHNISCITPQKNYKIFRADLALNLIDKTIDFQAPIPLTKRKIDATSDSICQTEMTIGIVNDQLFHCPVHDGNARCLVCLKNGILSKTTASCIGCSKALNHKIFICVYPCFRLFHLNPKNYLNQEEYHQVVAGYDQYDQEEEEQDDKELPLKPDTTELDQMYARTHADFDEDLIQHAIPINYEDNYRQKTKFKIIHSKKPGPRNKGGRQPKQRAEQTQGHQSEGGQEIKKTKKGQKKQVAQQEGQQQEQDPDTSRNAMMDFFQMVRKKVMSQKGVNPPQNAAI